MGKYFFILLTFIISTTAMTAIRSDWFDKPIEATVLNLHKSNFHSEIKKHNFMLVEFYAPWCSFCQKFAPEFAKLGDYLASYSLPIHLAKVDGSREEELRDQYHVAGYPTLKLFRYGKPLDYTGSRNADDIAEWLISQMESPASLVESVDQVEKFIDSHDIGVIGFYDKPTSEEAKGFMDIASSIKDFPFALCSNNRVFSEYEARNGDMAICKCNDDSITFIGD